MTAPLILKLYTSMTHRDFKKEEKRERKRANQDVLVLRVLESQNNPFILKVN